MDSRLRGNDDVEGMAELVADNGLGPDNGADTDAGEAAVIRRREARHSRVGGNPSGLNSATKHLIPITPIQPNIKLSPYPVILVNAGSIQRTSHRHRHIRPTPDYPDAPSPAHPDNPESSPPHP